MLTEAENQRLTRIGKGTPAGALMRLYWQPAALSEELPAERPVRGIRLLGEDLVLFRDEKGRLGAIGRYCTHRGVDLAYGRCEDGGLRCPFHGWLFGVDGACLERPAEPEGDRPPRAVAAGAYPCVERKGMIWVYMGPGDPPAFPDLDCFVAPDSHSFAFKGLWECNWLQATEVGVDPAHASFLHRFFEDEDTREGYGRQFRDRGAVDTDLPMTKLLREYPRPRIRPTKTGYGMRLESVRETPIGTHVRVTNQIFPHAICIPMGPTMTITQWHVPIDDENCYWYALFTSFDAPVDKERMREQRLREHALPDYRPHRNRENAYGYDPREQAARTYTGMGDDINVHDQWAVESPGPITDRTREHLGTSDIGIVFYRRALIDAMARVEAGNFDLPLRQAGTTGAEYRGPEAIDVLLSPGEEMDAWHAREEARRAQAPWRAPDGAGTSGAYAESGKEGAGA